MTEQFVCLRPIQVKCKSTFEIVEETRMTGIARKSSFSMKVAMSQFLLNDVALAEYVILMKN